MSSSTLARSVLVAALALLTCAAAHAQQTRDFTQLDSERVIDWYYASTFGTGVYSIGDRTVFVARLPFGLRLRESDEERWGVRLKLPVSVGLYRIPNQFGDVLERTNFAAVSVLPGVEFERQLTSRWTIRPTFSFGYGRDLGSSVSSRIWEVGVRSLYTVPLRDLDFVLGNALLYAGSNATTGTTQNLGIFSTGLNFIIPTGKELMGRPTNVGVHFIYYAYFNRLDFFLDAQDRREVDQQYELAMTVGSSKPFDILGFSADRIGVGFRIGDDFFAIRLLTGFLY
jgi:hypothetical protein